VINFSHIVDGWLRMLLVRFFDKDLPEDIEREIARRVELCMSCELFEKRENVTKLLRHRCSVCKCSFPGMAFSYKKSCPIGKWDSIPK